MKLLLGSSLISPIFWGGVGRFVRKSAAAVPLSLTGVFVISAGSFYTGAGIPSVAAAILSDKRSWRLLLFLVAFSSVLFVAKGNVADPILWVAMLGASISWREKSWPVREAITFSLTAHIVGSLLFLLRGGSTAYLQRIIALTVAERMFSILSFLGGHAIIRFASSLAPRLISRNFATVRSLLCSR